MPISNAYNGKYKKAVLKRLPHAACLREYNSYVIMYQFAESRVVLCESKSSLGAWRTALGLLRQMERMGDPWTSDNAASEFSTGATA